MIENTPPRRPSPARWWLLALALVLVIGAGYMLLRPPPTPEPPRTTATAPLPVLATSAPATRAPSATASAASPLVGQRDWIGLARTFDPQAAMAEIERLCARELAGREAGTPAGRQAAEYIAGRFEALGLEPAGDGGTYFQAFTVPLIEMTETPSLTVTGAGGKTFQARLVEDFMPVNSGYFGAGLAEGPLVWVGRGGGDGLQGASVSGAVAVLDFPPDGTAYARLIQGGAAGLLIAREDSGATRMGRVAREASQGRTIPVAYVGPDVVSAMLAGSGHTLSGLRAESGAVLLGSRARLEVVTRVEPEAPAQNVLAALPGRGDGVVVVGGHYDHLGLLPDGTFYPGANDNASGVAALLEIARSWQAAGFVPERTVLFAAWDAEEKGLLGSTYFVRHPTVPLASIEAMLQLDMVGWSPTPNLLIDGDGLVADHTLAAAAELGVQVELQEVGRSDHAPFRDAGEPATLYIWPAFDIEPYHRPGDTPATISPELLRQAGSLGELVALRLSMGEPVPAAVPAGEAVATPAGS